MANVGGVFVVLISGGFVAVVVSVFEMLLDIRNRSKELEVCLTTPMSFLNKFSLSSFKVPFVQELIGEIKFIAKCSGNTKTVNRKKSGASLDHESRSVSRSTCSQNRELTSADAYGFRPSLKNLERLDLMPENEIADKV